MSHTRFKITTITDVTGTRWWVNAWTDTTPYHAMGASSTRSAPAERGGLAEAKREALVSLKGGVQS